jgi:hypothetical protein
VHDHHDTFFYVRINAPTIFSHEQKDKFVNKFLHRLNFCAKYTNLKLILIKTALMLKNIKLPPTYKYTIKSG